MSLAELEKSEKGGEAAWKAATPALERIAMFLHDTPDDGPFFLGGTVSYADFVLVGFLQFCRRAGEDVFERVIKVDADGKFERHYKACEQWLERDGE